MKRCSLREWIPILPISVWPLAWQCLLGQNTVAGSMICSFWLCVEACQEEYVGIPIFITSAFHHGSRQRYRYAPRLEKYLINRFAWSAILPRMSQALLLGRRSAHRARRLGCHRRL